MKNALVLLFNFDIFSLGDDSHVSLLSNHFLIGTSDFHILSEVTEH